MKFVKYLLPLFTLLDTSLAYAYPPYIAVDSAENLSFSNSTCITKAQKALEADGFNKIATKGTTVFAAYRDAKTYEYKAAIKCVEDSGVIIVAVVADSLRNIKAKAQSLRVTIQSNFSTSSAFQSQSSDSTDENSVMCDDEPSFPAETIPSIANSWQQTKLSSEQCVKRAEIAIRNTGFSENVNFGSSSVTGNNGQYTASIKCLGKDGVILFTVAGTPAELTERLLKTLENNF